MSERSPATVSVDVDPVDLHLAGYGFAGLDPDLLVYTVAIPRLLEVFGRTKIRATFFIVGRDAEAGRDAVRAIVEAGHEVASHSMSHPNAFASLDDAQQDEELGGSRERLEAAGGGEVIGYRSPSFDIDRRGLEALVRNGYRYDASAYPTPLLLPARLLIALKSSNPRDALRLRKWPWSFDRAPFRMQLNGITLHEFPVSVTSGLRFPVYHTARYFTSDAQFISNLDVLAKQRHELSYPLHAVDVLGLSEDHVDERLARHPGMEKPLPAKLALLETSLFAIAERFASATFAERLAAA